MHVGEVLASFKHAACARPLEELRGANHVWPNAMAGSNRPAEIVAAGQHTSVAVALQANQGGDPGAGP